MMLNAPANIETANAANHHASYSRAERMPLRSGIVDTAKPFATYAAPSWLHALVSITAPLLAVTKCDHPRGCHTDPAN